jgi:ribosomal protein S19
VKSKAETLYQKEILWKKQNKVMKTEGKFAEDIEAKISRESKLNPEMVGYILKKEAPA